MRRDGDDSPLQGPPMLSARTSPAGPAATNATSPTTIAFSFNADRPDRIRRGLNLRPSHHYHRNPSRHPHRLDVRPTPRA